MTKMETTMIRFRLHALSLLLLLLAAPVLGQQAARQTDPGLLTLDTIFTYRPNFPGPMKLFKNTYLMLEAAQNGRAIVQIDPKTGTKTTLVPAERLVPQGAQAQIAVEEFDLSPDKSKLLIFTNSARVWRSNTRGDYWALDLKSGKLQKLGGDAKPSSLMFAKLSPDGTRAGYVRENNLYVEDLATGAIKQLTTDGSRILINGTFDWVYEEELFCRDGWRWSPDGKRIAYWQLNQEGVKDFLLVNYTDALYPKVLSFPYPKAGEMNSAARVGVIAADGGATRWFEVPGDPRNNYLPRMEWAANSDEVVIQQLNRLQNTLILMMGDARTGKVQPILTEKDDAWVDVSWGNIGWDKVGLARGDAEWIANGQRFLWTSERDGWRHVYSISRDGKDVKCITPGNFDLVTVEKVVEIDSDNTGGWLYFSASPDNATQSYLYRVPLHKEGKMERLTPAAQPGLHSYQIASDGSVAIHTYSTFSKAPVTEIVGLPSHNRINVIVENKDLQARLDALRPTPTEFIRVDIGDGVALDGWVIKPPNFDAKLRYPVLFHVYGEPAGQTVLDTWGGVTRLWHTMLAQQGYIVISVDNRGTPAPRGRAWRKSIYRQMGIRNSLDQAAAARAVAKWPYVDARRIGIWGWSGGGSSSLNAIFRYPDIYSMAMSVAPVPDIRYYDTIYQERYCGLPQDHPDEYKQSSPITFAGQLTGNLLIVHGTGDDNVHYQGTESLINALVAANKPFTMMAYPNRSHGIYEGPGTTKHLYSLLTRYLNEKLPPGPRSEASN